MTRFSRIFITFLLVLIVSASTLYANEGSQVTEVMTGLVLQIGIILFAVRIGGMLVKKFGIPSVLGELLAGVVIGPYALGAIALPGFPHGIFPLGTNGLAVSPELYGFATVASIILLFASGLETDLALFLRYSVVGGLVGLGGVVFSFASGAGVGMLLLDAPFMDPRCLFLGILSTATSVGITARILSDQKKMDSPEGVTILAAAVFDDVLGIIMLAVVLGIVAGMNGSAADRSFDAIEQRSRLSVSGSVLALGLIFSKIASFLKFFKHQYDFSICALGIALLLAGIFEKQGLAMIIGAYVTGLSLSKTDIAAVIQERIHGLYEFFRTAVFAVMVSRECWRAHVLGSARVRSPVYRGHYIREILGCALPSLGLGFNIKAPSGVGAAWCPAAKSRS